MLKVRGHQKKPITRNYVSSKMIKSCRMEQFMMESGKMIRSMEEESIHGLVKVCKLNEM